MGCYLGLFVLMILVACLNNGVVGYEHKVQNDTANISLVVDDPVAEVIEHDNMGFFVILFMLFLCVLLVAFLLNRNFYYLPEALAVMIAGVIIAAIIKYVVGATGVDLHEWKDIRSFQPDTFFLILLPPIIFESGYTLQKGDFFSNIGAILTYALLGTTVSAAIIGISMYYLGVAGLAYPLQMIESLCFGSLISATDPVSTLALFSSMNADSDLYAIVFGESVMNDAVSIILTQTLIGAALEMDTGDLDEGALVMNSIAKFCLMFFVSAIVGAIFGLVCAFVLKHVNLRDHPSLECLTMFIFAYMPYGLSEGLELSGIMAILFCGITMSHYAHYNLSPMGQIVIQQIFRILALIAETLVFLYLGMAVLNGPHLFDIKYVSWSLLACLFARAVVVYPLSIFFIFCRSGENRISMKHLFLIWFSGLRGAVAFAQSLHLPLANDDSRNIIVTTTLSIVIFTNIVLGGMTLPLVKFLNVQNKRPTLGISKSLAMGKVTMANNASTQATQRRNGKSSMCGMRGWRRFDKEYLMPFFIRQIDSTDYKSAVTNMIDQWAQRETRAAYENLTSSAEVDDNEGYIMKRTRKNIIRPVRNLFRTLDDANSDDEKNRMVDDNNSKVTYM